MPYTPGPVLEALGQAHNLASAPLPLDRIRARRMERQAAELEKFKADTQRMGTNEQVAAGTETRRQNANLEKYRELITSEMNKLPVITVGKEDPAYISQYMTRATAAGNHWMPEMQALSESMNKQLPALQGALPVDPNSLKGSEVASQNQRREDQTNIDKQKLTLGYAKLADDKKSAKTSNENQRLAQIAANDKIWAAKQTLLQNGYNENAKIPDEDRFRIPELVRAQQEAKRPYIIPQEWRRELALAADAVEANPNINMKEVNRLLSSKGISPYLLEQYMRERRGE